MKLNKKLEQLKNDGLISEQQYEDILAKEKGENSNTMLNGMYIFAAVLIGFGILALIAANWDKIPDALKLGGALALMGLNAFVVFKSVQNGKKTQVKIYVTLYAFLIAGVIGLIGQVFNLKSDEISATLLWSAASFPLLFVFPELFWVWLPLSQSALNHKFIDFLENQTEYTDETIANIALHFFMIQGCLEICVYELFAIWKKDSVITKALRFYIGLALFWTVIVVAVAGIFDNSFAGDLSEEFMSGYSPWRWKILAYLLPLFAAVTWLNYRYKRISFMPVFLGWLILLAAFPQLLQTANLLMTLAPFAVLAAYAYNHRMPKLFKAAIILMCLRILGLFIASTKLLGLGFSLILAGIFLIATVYAVQKLSKKMWRNN